MKVHVFVTMVSKSALKSPNLLPSFTKTAISLNDGITRMRTQNGSFHWKNYGEFDFNEFVFVLEQMTK